MLSRCLRQHVPALISVNIHRDRVYGQQFCPNVCSGMFQIDLWCQLDHMQKHLPPDR